jgi:hypothetical protein
MECLHHHPFLSLANDKDFGCNILGHPSSDPCCMPKWCLATISKGDDSGGIQNLHIFIDAREGCRCPSKYYHFLSTLAMITATKEPWKTCPNEEHQTLHTFLASKQPPN